MIGTRWTLLTLLTVMLAMAVLAGCRDGQWVAGTVASDDLAGVRGGWRPAAEGRTEVGVSGVWWDGLADGQREAWGGGAYGAYDVVQGADFAVLGFNVPVTWSVGGQGGILEREDGDEDAFTFLMTGLSFGDATNRIGIEYDYALDQDLWKEYPALDEDNKGYIVLKIEHRFK